MANEMWYNANMRLQVAKTYNTTLSRRDKHALTPERLYISALLCLYMPDETDLIAVYHEHFRHPDVLLRMMIPGHKAYLAPRPNAYQAALNALCPRAQTLNLYISTYKRPDYALSLARGADGLFHVTHPRIRCVGANPPRDGVFAYWSDVTPPPEHTFGYALQFSRVLRGGRAIQQMLGEVENDYELRRQLTNAVRLQRVLAAVPLKPEVTVYSSGALGKAVFSVDDSTFPFTFKGLRTRPNAHKAEKFRTRILGDVDVKGLLEIGEQIRYFGTEIKDAHHTTRLDDKTLSLVSRVLNLQTLPFVGVLTPEGNVDTYAMHYEHGRTAPAFLQTVKQRIELVPYFRPRDGRQAPEPNTELVACLREALLDREGRNVRDRQDLVHVIFGYFMKSPTKQDIVDYLEECGLPLSPDEIAEVLG
jgi:hypothetical protein